MECPACNSGGDLSGRDGHAGRSHRQIYDGAGIRVAQQATQGGVSTTTVYVGDLEAIATSGSSTTTTAYYSMDGQRFAEAVNGALSFLASDMLGSATVAFDASGNVEGQVLYAPYGTVRYVSGTMPTDYGFTGQRADALTGLDYFNARYYDAAAGQFASADTALAGGLNRYAYVGDDLANGTDWPHASMKSSGRCDHPRRLSPGAGDGEEGMRRRERMV